MQFLGYGDGRDGSVGSASGIINTYSPASGSSGNPVVTTALSVSVGDLVMLHQSRGSGVGNWELVRVLSVGSGEFTAHKNLDNSYSGKAQAVLVRQYTGGNMGSLAAQDWDGNVGGILAAVINQPLVITGTPTIQGKGFVGSSLSTSPGDKIGEQGEGYSAAGGTESQSANADGGGGGGKTNGAGGGGGGGHSGSGANGSGATVGTGGGSGTDNAALTNAQFGGAGGQGGQHTGVGMRGGGGGDGSGFGFICAPNITVTGGANGNGSNGGNATTVGGGDSTQGAGGGGAGAGGVWLFKGEILDLGSGLVTALGGTGGSGGIQTNQTNSPGGNGQNGGIHADYGISIAGTTSPSLDSTKDSSLNRTQGFAAFM